MNWEDILISVEKPSRYIGAEVNASKKDRAACKLSFVLAFPDTYEVGMSHLGLQILYAILNCIPEVATERCYAPWPDMEQCLRRYKLPLSTLESHIPLHQFDVIGFSLQYELSYTNVLNMLDLGNIPIHSRDRKEGHPLIIAGGPCTFNPAPMSPFIEAFVIGEGEEVVVEIAQTLLAEKGKGHDRHHILDALSHIPGVYVPSIHTHGEIIKKRLVTDLNQAPYPVNPVVPLMKTIHDRLTLEIARGCTRGCRFCQAGMVWRPVRERDPDLLEKMADGMLKATGCDELSLLSLSTGDYSLIEPLLIRLANRYAEQKVALSLPSMRVETLSSGLIEEIRRVRKTSFTLAPEAGTQRLRNIINKGNTEEDLLQTTGRVFEAGWKSIKLYFMLGLPGEGEADVDGIIDLGYKVLREGENRRQVTISLSTFVPKPHTPFQWHGQISLDETVKKQEYLKRHMRRHLLNVKWHDSRMSLIEGLLSRGSEKSGELIEKAFLLGCRFDGWTDRFRFDLWEAAIVAAGINIDDCMKERSFSETMSWNRIDCGVNTGYLISEAGKSLRSELTADCRLDSCSDCGVCDQEKISIMTASGESQNRIKTGKATQEIESRPSAGKRLRIKFAKRGMARFLSHLEVSTALIRAINRSGIKFIYSEGFHPHPKISFATATPVGLESRGEYMEIQIKNLSNGTDGLLEKINRFLPAGIEIIAIEEIPLRGKTLYESVKGFTYEIRMADKIPETDMIAMERRIESFLKAEKVTLVRDNKGKSLVKDIRPLLEFLSIDKKSRLIKMTAMVGEGGTVRPIDILTEVLGLDENLAKRFHVIKTDTHFDHS